MKIKKIDFQHDKGESYDIYYAILPVGHDARVELTCESKDTLDGSECWSWEIDTERYTGKCGVAKTKELAMEACQAAWEKMVMEAFEEEEGKKSKCKFCNDPHEPIHDLKGYPQYNDFTAKVDENGPSIDVHYVVNGRDRYEYMDIDYCPICGRKLEGEQ